jgi:hypothetical protein
MKTRNKAIIDVIGIRLMYAIVINFYIILIVAMFGDHTVEVIFNHYNEAYIEYIIYIIIFPIMTYSLLCDIKRRRRRKKQMKGIQKAIYEYIKKSKQLGLDYVPTRTLIEEMKKIRENKDWEPKVSQALYQLQKSRKFKRPLIKKVYSKDNQLLGYTTIEDKRKL